MKVLLVSIRYTARVLAVALIAASCAIQLLVILLTALVSVLDAPIALSPALMPLEDTVATMDDDLDDAADVQFTPTDEEPLTVDELDELIATMPEEDTTEVLPVEFVGYQSLKWNDLRNVCKAAGIKGCKTRVQYETAYVALFA